MASLFLSIPERSNGQDVFREWWNDLRTAGMSLEGFLGSGYIPCTSQSLSNAAAATSLTGFAWAASGAALGVHVEYRAFRKTASSEVLCRGFLDLLLRPSTGLWELVPGVESGDPSGLTFSVVGSSGQLQYASDSMAGGSYDGFIHATARVFK